MWECKFRASKCKNDAKYHIEATSDSWAAQLDLLLPKIKNKNIALGVNYTATLGKTYLTDTSQSRSALIKKLLHQSMVSVMKTPMEKK